MIFKKKKEPVIYCYDCKCVLYRVSKRVQIIGFRGGIHCYIGEKPNFGDRVFCGRCAPLYDEIDYGMNDEELYYQTPPPIRVTKEGKHIKK